MDKILVKGLKLFAYHGVNPEEKENGQNFILDITACLDLSCPGKTDCLDDTLNYSKLIKTASAIFTSEKNDLIERAAHRVAYGLLEEFEIIKKVTVLLKKPEAPVKADIEYAAVEITAKRNCTEDSE